MHRSFESVMHLDPDNAYAGGVRGLALGAQSMEDQGDGTEPCAP